MATTSGTILLTGANGGIGVGFVSQLLKSQYATTKTAVYAVRDTDAASKLKGALENAPQDHEYLILPADVSSIEALRDFSAEINARVARGDLPPIQALVLNAGIQDNAKEEYTIDGFERTFAINYLSNFLLSLLLLESMDREHGRIIFIGSTFADIHWGTNKYAFSSKEQMGTWFTTMENISKGVEEHPDGDINKKGQRKYALSKLLLMVWMYVPSLYTLTSTDRIRRYEFQRRLDADPRLSKIAVLGHDPGWVGGTDISRTSNVFVQFFLKVIVRGLAYVFTLFSNPLMRTAAKNGNDLLGVCFDDQAFGEFPKAKYINGSVLHTTPEETKDERRQEEVWKESLKFAKVNAGETVLVDWM
jgi:NAD(P)-dependent dehydrogenase (short-subunit alcohol dehydrogenase family)